MFWRSIVQVALPPLLSIAAALSFVVHDAAAQQMGKKACENANWMVLGADDALNGRAEQIFPKRQENCAKKSIHANAADWQAGYDTMLPVLCDAEFSYGLGKRGRRLEASCPTETIREAVNANGIGFEYHKLRSAYENAVKSHNDDVNAINSAQSDIRQAQSKLGKSDLTAEQIQKQQNKISRAVKNIESLHSGLDYKKTAAAIAEGKYLAFEPTATAFGRELAIKRGLNGDHEMALELPLTIGGKINEGENSGLVFDVERPATPVLFRHVYVGLADFKSAENTRDGDIKCSLERKLKRKIGKAWKALKMQEANVNVHSMKITPPSYQTSHSVDLVGDVILTNGDDLATQFIEQGLAVRENESPLSVWFKDKVCFLGAAAPGGDAAEFLLDQ